MTPPTLLISDLHLREDDPATLDAFTHFMAETATRAAQLFLLGDLFEYWAGDDDDSPLISKVAKSLADCAAAGVRLYLIHGNRDFLIGKQFAIRANLTILNDPSEMSVGMHRFLISHGDALCTDDIAYQQFRQNVRNPVWQEAFLSRPLAERHREIARLRAGSKQANAQKSSDIMDVNLQTVSALLLNHPDTILIHGHTHRPARHQLTINGKQRERWVLPDWDRGNGGYCVIDETGIRLVSLNATHEDWCKELSFS